jgi:hypothetical protein
MYGLAHRMEVAFIDSLPGMLAPNGRIFLSETVQGCFLHPSPDGQWMTDGMYRMTRTTQLRDYIDDRFRVEHHGKWVWVMEPATENGQVGRLYNVQALVLSLSSPSGLRNDAGASAPETA